MSKGGGCEVAGAAMRGRTLAGKRPTHPSVNIPPTAASSLTPLGPVRSPSLGIQTRALEAPLGVQEGPCWLPYFLAR